MEAPICLPFDATHCSYNRQTLHIRTAFHFSSLAAEGMQTHTAANTIGCPFTRRARTGKCEEQMRILVYLMGLAPTKVENKNSLRITFSQLIFSKLA